MYDPLRATARKVIWIVFKHPMTLVLICAGLIFEFLLFLPFAVLCRLDSRARRG